MREFYVILGVDKGASPGAIRKAYQKLARKYHPDINPGDPAAADRFVTISEAYDVLSDPDKRRFYDDQGYWVEGIVERRNSSRLDFSFEGFGTPGSGPADYSDLFDDFFARARSRQRPADSNDVEAQVLITFEEAISGVRTAVAVYRRRMCEDCQGFGRRRGAPDFGCPACDGEGKLVRAKGYLRFTMTCPECEGSGRVAPACPACRGEGQTVRSERVRVDIPPGVSTGSRIRYAGRGNADARSGKSGDLYVVTNVADHPVFRRVGDNVYCTVPVTVTEAALGARVDVPCLDGIVSLRVPPGAQSGQSLRLRGKGAPSLRGDGVRGDQYVEIRVVVPKIADERSREILRELARLNPSNPRNPVGDSNPGARAHGR
jgi:molecular chaperone DnaJ